MTLDRAPKQALNPESQDWVRWAEGNFFTLDKRLEDKYSNDIANSFRANTSSLRKVAEQVALIQRQSDEIAANQASIIAQQNYLNSLRASSAGTTTGGNFGAGGWWSGPSTVLACPTGALRIVVSGTIVCGSGSGNRAGLTFGIPGEVLPENQMGGMIGGDFFSGVRNGIFANNIGGSGGSGTGSFVQYIYGLVPGVKTITAWAWATGPLIVAGGVTVAAEVIPAQ